MKRMQRPPLFGKAFLCHDLPYGMGEGMGVQLRPPSTVLNSDEAVGVGELIAQPIVAETKSSWATFLKLAAGESFSQ